MLSQGEAAEGVSERTFRRWRYEAEGAEGLYDRRLGRVSARRADVDEVAQVLELFDTRYRDFNARHFHEKLVACHGVQRSYVRLTLQAHGRVRAAPRRGAHRRKRPRRALPGAPPGRLAPRVGVGSAVGVTMDDATSEVYSAFFVAEEGTLSRRFARWSASAGCSARSTPAATTSTRPRPAARSTRTTRPRSGAPFAGVEHIAAYSPEARGRSERVFGTLQKRLSQELRLAGVADMAEANRFLKQVYLPGHNRRFATPPERVGLRALRRHPRRPASTRTVSNDTRYKGRTLQADRHHYVKAKVRVHEYPDHTLAVFHGPGRLALYRADRSPTTTRKAA